jgi:predicted enzyme involved in methoxymalonyl-ACP biosynthesis
MTCRAFSRRVEYACLAVLFETFTASAITFDFRPTPKNGPIREFFAGVLGHQPESGLTVTKETFDARCPALQHRIERSVPA